MATIVGRTGYLKIGMLSLSLAGVGSGVWLFGISGRSGHALAAKPKEDSLDSGAAGCGAMGQSRGVADCDA